MAEISPARTAAFRILSRLHEKPDDQTPLPALLEESGKTLSLRDAALAAEIIYGVLRKEARLFAALRPFLARPEGLPLRLRLILAMAAFELLRAVGDGKNLPAKHSAGGCPGWSTRYCAMPAAREPLSRHKTLWRNPAGAMRIRTRISPSQVLFRSGWQGSGGNSTEGKQHSALPCSPHCAHAPLCVSTQPGTKRV